MNQKVMRGYAMVLVAAGISTQISLPAFADASVRVAGRPVLTLSAGAAGMTADQRAATMQKNIDNALVASNNRTPSAVAVTYVSGQPIVTLGGFYVATVDAASAKRAGLTTAALASRWSGNLKQALSNQAAVRSYVDQLASSDAVGQAGTSTTQAGSYPYYRQGHIVYIPAGMTLPVTLNTPLTSQTAQPGDKIEATLAETINLGNAEIPAKSILIGQVTTAQAGARLGKSGTLGFKFTRLRTPDGCETPIQAHLIGGVESLGQVAPDTDIYKGETTKTKVEKAALHGAVGAGAGALLGTTIGAIAGGGRGAGRGAWSGLALGAGLGVAESLLLRKGADVKMASGHTLKLQLDAPASVAISGGNL